MKSSHYIRNLIISIPFVVLTLLVFVAIALQLHISLDAKLIALGALGWWIALLLRLPVSLLTKKKPLPKAQLFMTLSSGPAEELVRLLFLVVLGLSVNNAYSVGIGWAAIEIVYGIIQGFAMASLQHKTDPKAEEAKAVLKSMGMDKALEPLAPFWGILERLSANALHISFSLALVLSPFLVLVTAPLHSALNYLLTRLMKTSIVTAECALFVVSGILFAAMVVLSLLV